MLHSLSHRKAGDRKKKIARMSFATRAQVFAMRNPPKGYKKVPYGDIQKVILHVSVALVHAVSIWVFEMLFVLTLSSATK